MEMAMENITRAQQEVEMSSQFNIRFTVMMNVAQPVGDTSYNYKYTIRSIVCEASCHPVTRSLGHSITWSIGHSVTWSFGHSVIRSLGHLVVRSLCHSVTWSLGHLVTQSLGNSVT